jgi:hypothetical protein
LKSQEEILVNSKPIRFSIFSFDIHYESEEVPMDKVVPFFKSITTIFYFKNFELGKVLFGSVKVWKDLNFILFHLNSNFELNSMPLPVTVAQGPLVSKPDPPLFRRQRAHAARRPTLLMPAGSGPLPLTTWPPSSASPPCCYKRGCPHHRRSLLFPFFSFRAHHERTTLTPFPLVHPGR